jgi:hypothetical protein
MVIIMFTRVNAFQSALLDFTVIHIQCNARNVPQNVPRAPIDLFTALLAMNL